MDAKIKIVNEAEIKYFVKGENPTLLIHSGTHGDESGVIESVKLAVNKYENQLPEFIFVPMVSPSAVKRKTRENIDGVDMNRSFYDGCRIPEVQANMEIMKGMSFDMMISFHEDTDADAKFYLYDIRGSNLGNTEKWKHFKNEVIASGFELLTGLDDPADPKLSYLFVDGYRHFNLGDVKEALSYWAADHRIIKKSLEPEIPTHLTREKKNELVDLIFRHFLIRNTRK